MRILALRGENLASLQRFEVSLSQGPLSECGIFVISGPTGAGKSTLLDAICLALYDTTPRLAKEQPISLVRQSSVEAYAEVDFASADKRTYRARWHVQRARKKPSGQWQDQTLTLTELPSGKVLSDHRKMDTLKKIESLVGLSFDQFRRSVLLAQGDFALFLSARGDERARLLEKITGTEIYARLSAAAFRKAKDEQEALLQLRQELERERVLGQEEREQLLSRRTQLGKETSAQKALVASARTLVDWHKTEAGLSREVADAKEALARAQVGLLEIRSLESQIAEFDRALHLGPLLDAKREAQHTYEKAELSSRRTQERERVAKEALVAEKSRCEAAASEFRFAQEARNAAEPQIQSAKQVDLQLAAQTARAQGAAQVCGAAERAAEELALALRAKEAECNRLDEGLTEARRYLEEHGPERRLCKSGDRLFVDLGALILAEQRLAEHLSQKASLADARARAEKEHEAAALAWNRSKDQVAQAKQRWQAAKLSYEAELAVYLPRGDIEAEQKAILHSLERWMTEEGTLREALLLHRTVEEAKETESKERAELAACQEKLGLHRQTLSAVSVALKEAQTDLRLLLATQELSTRRKDLLISGQPCPLCGSTSHPALSEGAAGSVIAADVAALEKTTVALSASQEEEVRSLAKVEERLQTHRERAGEAARRQVVTFSEERLKDKAQVEAALKEVQHKSQEAREGLSKLRALAERLRGLAETAQELEAACTPLVQAAEERRLLLEGAAETVRRREAEWQSFLERETDRQERVEQLRSCLVSPMQEQKRWWTLLFQSPQTLLGELSAAVKECQGVEDRLNQGIVRSQKVREELAALRVTAGGAWERAAVLREQADEAESERCRLRELRKTLLQGQDAKTVESILKAAEAEAAAASEKAHTRLLAQEREDAAAREAAQGAKEVLENARTKTEAAGLALCEALDRTGLTEESLATWLRQDPGHGDTLRGEITRRRAEHTQVEALLADRVLRLSAHEQRYPQSELPAGGKEREQRALLAEASLHEAESALAEASEEAYRLELTLSEDEKRVRLCEALLVDIADKDKSAAAWGRLSELIGSADGKKFRQFAQGLTLDTLLAHANYHLLQLRPRYRIERVAASDMDLQVVDHDMGEEIRCCATLSGGESFLVSLALALGLSSLSCKNVRVESLFIDEGFGTLDRDTLEVALSTLEELAEQGGGRQVGLISHVADLAERIGYQVLVEPRRSGESRLRVVGDRR